MKKIKKLANLWLPVFGWCGLLFYLSSIPHLRAAKSPLWDEIIRSFLHLVFYTVLYLLFYRALNFGKEEKDYFWPFFFAFTYGIFDEIHQSFVPTRTLQGRDLAVDFIGAVLGGYLLWKWLPKAPKKLRDWAKKLAFD